ncbi:MAG: hypothetical protein ACK4M6_00725 [Hyphomonas sp.]
MRRRFACLLAACIFAGTAQSQSLFADASKIEDANAKLLIEVCMTALENEAGAKQKLEDAGFSGFEKKGATGVGFLTDNAKSGGSLVFQFEAHGVPTGPWSCMLQAFADPKSEGEVFDIDAFDVLSDLESLPSEEVPYGGERGWVFDNGRFYGGLVVMKEDRGYAVSLQIQQ